MGGGSHFFQNIGYLAGQGAVTLRFLVRSVLGSLVYCIIVLLQYNNIKQSCKIDLSNLILSGGSYYLGCSYYLQGAGIFTYISAGMITYMTSRNISVRVT